MTASRSRRRRDRRRRGRSRRGRGRAPGRAAPACRDGPRNRRRASPVRPESRAGTASTMLEARPPHQRAVAKHPEIGHTKTSGAARIADVARTGASRPPERPSPYQVRPARQRGRAMSETTEPAPAPRRGLSGSSILVVVSPLLWVGYWYAARQVAAMAFDRAVASLAAAERDIACDESASAAFRSASISTAATSPSTTGEAGRRRHRRPGHRDRAALPAGPGRGDRSPARCRRRAGACGVSLRLVVGRHRHVDAGSAGSTARPLALDQVEIVPGAGKNRMPFTHASADQRHDLRAARRRRRLPLHARRHRPSRSSPRRATALPPMAIDAERHGARCRRLARHRPGRTLAAWLAERRRSSRSTG